MGPMADNAHDLLGCWWGHGEDQDIQKLLAGIQKEFAGTSEVRYAKGCDFDGDNESGFKEAEALAKWADVVIMCMGEKVVGVVRIILMPISVCLPFSKS